MRCHVAIFILFASSGMAQAEGPTTRPRPAGVNAVVDRGLSFMAKDALAWKKEHNCVSCHHAALMIWSMREARGSGFKVDEPVLAELTKWVAESGDGKVSQSRPAGAPQALNTKALHFALALSADSHPDTASQNGMKRLLETVKSDQTRNGSWSAWPETRPPIFGPSDESMTALAILALMPAATGGDEAAKSARDKAVRWLAESKTDDDPQSIALRLIIWERLGRPARECASLIHRIKERQNADGGWSQTKDMPSDAWATGQALYALSHAGLRPPDPAIQRGHAFLIETQRPDGSWPMTSRPARPNDQGAHNLIPITGAASAWAVMGLARTR
jgi:hypothetical protein